MKTIAFAAAAIAMLGGGLAHAQTETDRETVKISSINSTADAKNVLGRLESAALDVCGAPFGSSPEYIQVVRGSACYRATLNRAVSQANVPALSDAYAATTTRSGWKVATSR